MLLRLFSASLLFLNALLATGGTSSAGGLRSGLLASSLSAGEATMATAPSSGPAKLDLLTQVQEAKWLPGVGSGKSDFGFAVAFDGNTAIVGARAENSCGAAYIFVRDAGGWTQQAKLFASDATVGADFGFSVAVEGDIALVGAYLAKNENKTLTGAVYVFVRHGGAWSQQAKLVPKGSVGFDFFWRRSRPGRRHGARWGAQGWV